MGDCPELHAPMDKMRDYKRILEKIGDYIIAKV
jgi:hypothetical protein